MTMVVCPTCGSARSMRAKGGARECAECYTVYERPVKSTRRRASTRSKPVDEQAAVEEPQQEE